MCYVFYVLWNIHKDCNVTKTVAFVPLKLNNERLPGKNTKSFSDGVPLVSCILQTLKQVSNIDEIVV